ncbi:unnamed protein product [Meganyctiphanes norvegica]|uniref:RecQ-mediated genome instability protein 2 n=1 Tax=Meganyctiphanes norvegica TaxID=48144 RepID=A0AAV2SB44_MEGNR
MSSGSKFDQPARKFRAVDIEQLVCKNDQWWYKGSSGQVQVILVWLQGRVVSLSPDKTQVELEDDGWTLPLKNCHTIPGGNSWLQEGQYVMVVGEVKGDTGNVAIHVLKMADLSSNSVHKTTWPLEVQEIKSIIG